MICPIAKITVKTLMPAAHCDGTRLCFTMAVVEATTDKKTPPNNKPETSIMGHALEITRMTVATLSKAFKIDKDCPPRYRFNKPAQILDEATTASPSKA